MGIPNPETIQKFRELLNTPRASLEKEFSPYFYRYLGRYKNLKKWNAYVMQSNYFFEKTMAKDAKVLDLGCGFGMMATLFRLFGSEEVVGYDLNTEKIGLFQKLISYIGSETNNVKPVLGDSTRIKYPDEYFDVVITNETLSHVREMESTIDEVNRVLKPGGRFLIRDGNNSLFLWGRVRRRMFWHRVEKGPVDHSSFRSTDIPLPFLEVRKKMIFERFPEMDLEELDLLSKETLGLYGDEIYEAVIEFERTGKISKHPEFPYRNPITGEFPEREINPIKLKVMLRERGFEIAFIPFFPAASFSNIEMIIKSLFYLIGKHLSFFQLFFTPGFALLGVKKESV